MAIEDKITEIKAMQATNKLANAIAIELADGRLDQLRKAYRENGWLETTTARKMDEAIRDFVGKELVKNPDLTFSKELASQAYDYVLEAARSAQREVG